MVDLLRDIITRNRSGQRVAIASVCSAQADVLKASLLRAEALDQPLVIEATSNQVNQFGGYTGMQPVDFVQFVQNIANEAQVDLARITLGGDHLGPQAWRSEPAESAMAKARDLVSAYVKAGFGKIHLDCSEGCSGEPAQLDDAVAAERAADLAKVCLDAAQNPDDLLFVIGTEVPPPGGARADDHGDIVATTPSAAHATFAAHIEAFAAAGLAEFTHLIGGLVVQPGVEFTPMTVHHLPEGRDPGLLAAISGWPNVCLEAHSTDYQQPDAYGRLADMGFAFQKVGPALTFAYRQALYGLDTLRQLRGGDSGAGLATVMEDLMIRDPGFWRGHYHGTGDDLRVMRHFGLADRIRYYWPRPEARAAVDALFDRLGGAKLPDPLLWQVFDAATLERAEALRPAYDGDHPRALVAAAIQIALDPYFVDASPAANQERSV